MSLASGDLTTFENFSIWYPNISNISVPLIKQLISATSTIIFNKLNRARLFSQTFTRVFDGQGTYQIVLPDYPVTSISSVQMGAALIPAVPLPVPNQTFTPNANNTYYGYRVVPWSGNLPGDPAVLEFVNGVWWWGVQNIKITYNAGYLISSEAWTVPSSNQVTVLQPQGMWCKDSGVVYASTGVALLPVASAPSMGEYVPPSDSAPGLYTFSSADMGANVLISYSFVPVDLTEACNQFVAERYSYRMRIGEESKSLGGQETIKFMRGGLARSMFPDLPPEVEGMILPYVSVIPPVIGAPV